MGFNKEEKIHNFFHLGKKAQRLGFHLFAYKSFRISMLYFENIEFRSAVYMCKTSLPGLSNSAYKRMRTCRQKLSERNRKKLEVQEKGWKIKDSFYTPNWEKIVSSEELRLWLCYFI